MLEIFIHNIKEEVCNYVGTKPDVEYASLIMHWSSIARYIGAVVEHFC